MGIPAMPESHGSQSRSSGPANDDKAIASSSCQDIYSTQAHMEQETQSTIGLNNVELKKLVFPLEEAQSDAQWSQWMNSQRSLWDDEDIGRSNFEDLFDIDDDDVCENGELPPEMFEDDDALECDE